ncbi:MAG: hypothetical protein ABJA82_01890 [Myxococcales bacterium]
MNKVVIYIADIRRPEVSSAPPALLSAWLMLHAHCSEQENGGRIGRIPAKHWDVLLVRSGGKKTIDQLVEAGLAHWEGDELVVNWYDVEGEAKYIATRGRGRLGGLAKAVRDRAHRSGGEPPAGTGLPPSGSHGSSYATSHSTSHSYQGKGEEGNGREGKGEQREVREGEAEGGMGGGGEGQGTFDPWGPAMFTPPIAVSGVDYAEEPEFDTADDVQEAAQ